MTTKERDRIEILEGRMEKLEEMNYAQEKKIDKILFYFESDSSTNQKGIVENVKDLRGEVQNLLKREEIYKGKATVWGIVGSAIFGTVGTLLYVGIKFLITKI